MFAPPRVLLTVATPMHAHTLDWARCMGLLPGLGWATMAGVCPGEFCQSFLQEAEAMLEPLLRSAGNMASSAAAVAVLGAPCAISVISQIGQHERYTQEASWVLANLEAAKRWAP